MDLSFTTPAEVAEAQKTEEGEESGAELKAKPYKLAIQSLFLTNFQSLNKMDELQITSHCLDSDGNNWTFIPDAATFLTGHGICRVDRAIESSKKCGGLCVWVNNSWHTNATFKDTHCCPDRVSDGTM